ncbi:MAG: hypothetical protein Kow0031_07460 [Anaerolineae bacterium]
MTSQPPPANKRALAAEVAISLGLFLLALIPRGYDLARFVTADEAKWVYRSAQFWAALLQGDWAGTTVNLTPAVTTTWLGGLGLTAYHWLHQAELGLPLTGWLLSLPEFRVELPVLVATRWPMALFTSLAVVALYWLTRRLLGRPVALLAALLVALSPHTLALSRILGHDAPAAMFAALSLLALLLSSKGAESSADTPHATRHTPHKIHHSPFTIYHSLLWAALSGIFAGLAFLSKAPTLFLIPFAGLLVIVKIWRNRSAGPGNKNSRGDTPQAPRPAALFLFNQSRRWLALLLLWGAAGYLTFVLAWPAAWLDPVGRPWAVVENAFLSATDDEEADSENYWRVPELGAAYYLVNGGFKLSPLVMVGGGLALIFLAAALAKRQGDDSTGALLWLLLFALLFTLFMTLGTKRSARYILPIFPPLAVVAAWGWLQLGEWVGRLGRKGAGEQQARMKAEGGRRKIAGPQPGYHLPFTIYHSLFTLLFLAALLIQWPYAPYYFTYYNPLLGGAFTAPRLVKIGWGEGLDRVGRFLQRELPGARVGTPYASTVAPYFAGDLAAITADKLDYLVLYRKQVQSGEPFPEAIRYFEETSPPVFSVPLNGIDYADIYAGPGVQPAAETPPLNRADGAQPVGFRPLLPYGQIGRPLPVDVVWRLPANRAPNGEMARLSLHPLDAPDSPPLAEDETPLAVIAPDLVLSRHSLSLPADLPRGVYLLAIDGAPLGQIDLRHFHVPDSLGKITGVTFDGQVALVGYQWEPTEDYIRVTAAWQAEQRRLPDLTVFVQLLDAATGSRVAGFDSQPVRGEWPTSRWAWGEVVVDDYLVAIPPDLSPGHYLIIVGLYHPDTGERLTLADGQDHWLLPWTFIWE